MAFKQYLMKLNWTLEEAGRIRTTAFTVLHIIDSNLQELLDAATDAWMEIVVEATSSRKHMRNMPPIDREASIAAFATVPEKYKLSMGLESTGGCMLNSQKAHFDAQLDGICTYCPEIDSHRHRVLHCTATQEARASHASICAQLEESEELILVFPLAYKSTEDQFLQDLLYRIPEPQPEMPHSPKPTWVYTDGSCYLPNSCRYRWSAFAIVCPAVPLRALHQLKHAAPDVLLQKAWMLNFESPLFFDHENLAHPDHPRMDDTKARSFQRKCCECTAVYEMHSFGQKCIKMFSVIIMSLWECVTQFCNLSVTLMTKYCHSFAKCCCHFALTLTDNSLNQKAETKRQHRCLVGVPKRSNGLTVIASLLLVPGAAAKSSSEGAATGESFLGWIILCCFCMMTLRWLLGMLLSVSRQLCSFVMQHRPSLPQVTWSIWVYCSFVTCAICMPDMQKFCYHDVSLMVQRIAYETWTIPQLMRQILFADHCFWWYSFGLAISGHCLAYALAAILQTQEKRERLFCSADLSNVGVFVGIDVTQPVDGTLLATCQLHVFMFLIHTSVTVFLQVNITHGCGMISEEVVVGPQPLPAKERNVSC